MVREREERERIGKREKDSGERNKHGENEQVKKKK